MANMSVELAPEDDEVRQRVANHFQLMKSHIRTRMMIAAGTGVEAMPEEHVDAHADLLTCFVYSANQQLRLGSPPDEVLKRAEALVAALA